MRRELTRLGGGPALLLLLLLGACEREPAKQAPTTPPAVAPAPGPMAAPAPTPAVAPVPAPPGNAPAATSVLASAPFYRVELAAPATCARGAACELALVVRALGDYKVNIDYPHKLVGAPPPAVALEGPGAFATTDPKTGVLTVRFRADRAGPARVAGTFKFSVCTDELCEIASPAIALEIPVT